MDFIFLAGSPGSGKSTIALLLKEKLDSPYIELSDIRNLHLDPKWEKSSDEEETMSFENLVSILKNYKKNGYENVIVTDLRDHRIVQIPALFQDTDYVILTLYVTDGKELERRVLDESRSGGFQNVKEALYWNEHVQKRQKLTNEYKIDNTHNDPLKTLKQINEILKDTSS